ncbi:MAG: Tm-1-like ATP-binding domain-containing protein [Pseudomonadota bacterium]
MSSQVLVLATLETKAEETQFLMSHLQSLGLTAEVVDISLDTKGKVLSGRDKSDAMNHVATSVFECVSFAAQDRTEVIIGVGGGTGGQIIMDVMRQLPITFPKILVTTLPFDPRFALADNSIMLVPTLADLSGLNTILRDVLENTAHMAAGLCGKKRKGELKEVAASIGITALGATDGAVGPLAKTLQAQGHETTIFHANGFGGAAFARFAAAGVFEAIVDLTPHEMSRIHIAGAHVEMPGRFSAASDIPRVLLPGALNFIGLGQRDLIPNRYLDRPNYAHSALFTHVKVLPEEMAKLAELLAHSLNKLTGPRALIVPMGGFSHQDRPGGEIEDPHLRQVFLTTMQDNLHSDVPITVSQAHLFDPSITDTISKTLDALTAQRIHA